MTLKTSNGSTVKVLVIIIGILVTGLGGTLAWVSTSVTSQLEANTKALNLMSVELGKVQTDIKNIKENFEKSASQVGTLVDKFNEVDKKVDIHIATEHP